MDDYFWLFCGTWCGLFGAGYMRYRLRERVETGDFSAREATSFSRAYALWILLPCAFLWVLQESQRDGASFMFLHWAQPQRSLALSVQFFVWTALLSGCSSAMAPPRSRGTCAQ